MLGGSSWEISRAACIVGICLRYVEFFVGFPTCLQGYERQELWGADAFRHLRASGHSMPPTWSLLAAQPASGAEVALAAVSAIRNTGRGGDADVSTTGGSSAALADLSRLGSPLLGTYSFFPELWGSDVFDLAERMLAGEAVPERSSPRQQMFVTAANAAQFETPR